MRLRALRSLVVGVCSIGALAMNLGMKLSGNPGDCVVADDPSFASLGGGCKDLGTGRVWSLQPDSNWSYDNAVSYCNNLVEGGQSDWRMPTIDELKAVYAHGGSSHLKLTQLTPANWSSTTTGGKNFYGMRFSDGNVAIYGTKPGSKYGWWYLYTICTR